MLPTILDLASLKAAYVAGLSPLDLVEEIIARRKASDDPAIFITMTPDDDLRTAARELVAKAPEPNSLPLWGIPFAVKDNIDVAGLPTTAACPAFAYRPEEDATVIARLKAAGAIVIGKTNLDQFATGLNGSRSPHGAPRSVFDRNYVSGGSSSGSAVAVAAGLASFSLGTDTAGSGRVPAAFNNLVGIKPTPGLVPNVGVVPACRSVDVVTVFAATVGTALPCARSWKAMTSGIHSRGKPCRQPYRHHVRASACLTAWSANSTATRMSKPSMTPPSSGRNRWALLSYPSTMPLSGRRPNCSTMALGSPSGWRR